MVLYEYILMSNEGGEPESVAIYNSYNEALKVLENEYKEHLKYYDEDIESHKISKSKGQFDINFKGNSWFTGLIVKIEFTDL